MLICHYSVAEYYEKRMCNYYVHWLDILLDACMRRRSANSRVEEYGVMNSCKIARERINSTGFSLRMLAQPRANVFSPQMNASRGDHLRRSLCLTTLCTNNNGNWPVSLSLDCCTPVSVSPLRQTCPPHTRHTRARVLVRTGHSAQFKRCTLHHAIGSDCYK